MSAIRMMVAAQSDVGRARSNNEDAFTVTDLDSGVHLTEASKDHEFDLLERGLLLAVSDGMGGHEAGEVASALVVESLDASLQNASGNDAIEKKIEAAVKRANAAVRSAATDAGKHGMGATLTAVFAHGANAYIAEVGDSRAYLLRGGRLRQITKDQSLVQLLVDRGLLTPEGARTSSQRSVILQAMGRSADVRVAIGRLSCRRDDRLLLCSDGVSNAVTDDELRDALWNPSPKAACDRLIDLANERGGADNLTAVVARLAGDGLDLPTPTESITESLEVIQAFESDLERPTATPAPAPEPEEPTPPRLAQQPAPPSAPTPSTEEPARSKRSALPWLVLAVVGIAAAVALGWALLGNP